MSLFEKIIHALDATMEVPQCYGLWHIASVLLVAALTAFLVLRFRNADDRTLRRIIFTAWALMVVSEIYKQLIFSLSVTDGVATWKYLWYAFPFQFCSMPLYALPVIIWAPEGRVRDAVMAFVATFSLFAGLAVMCYPGDVFTNEIGINIQTMLHHGLQVVLGVFLFAYARRRATFRSFLTGIPVFATFVLTAMVLNLALPACIPAVADADFNMFFISPYHDCTLPVLSSLYPILPYPIFLLLYIFGFTVVAGVIYAIERGILALLNRKQSHVEK